MRLRFPGLLLLAASIAATPSFADPARSEGTATAPVEDASRSARPRLLRQITGDFRDLFTRRENLLVAGIGGGLALGAATIDHRIARSRLYQEETALDRAFEAGGPLGVWGLHVGGAVATYAWGAVLEQPAVEDLGAELIRAQVTSGAITSLLKVATRRERPDASSRSSFPSGHASAAFATATVIQRRLGARAGLPALLIAGYVASSRLNEGSHYLSDALFGSALGVLAGRVATREEADRPRMSLWMAPDVVGVQLSIGGSR